MSIGDELPPTTCLSMAASDMQEQLVRILDNLPTPDDAPEDAAKKYTIVGKCLRAMREDVKESLKATVNGQDGVAYTLLRGAEHMPLQSFAQVSITGPDGETVEIDPKTALANLDKAQKRLANEANGKAA